MLIFVVSTTQVGQMLKEICKNHAKMNIITTTKREKCKFDRRNVFRHKWANVEERKKTENGVVGW